MPRMEADFDWTDVQASVPVHDKGDYELTIERVRGQAWYQKDQQGNLTQNIVKVIKLTPKIVGQFDSRGQLDTAKAGQAVEEIGLWIHSEGARQMAKKTMMAICGYNPQDEQDEKKFNEMLRNSGLDLKTSVEDGEDGKMILKIGEGYEKLLKGKNVRVNMEPETREVEGKDPVVQQKFNRYSQANAPVQKASAPARGRQPAGAGR